MFFYGRTQAEARAKADAARERVGRGEPSLTPEEVARLLQGAADLRYAKVLRLVLGTGLRRGEALALRWPDLGLDRCELSVKGSLTRRGSGLVVSDAKTLRRSCSY